LLLGGCAGKSKNDLNEPKSPGGTEIEASASSPAIDENPSLIAPAGVNITGCKGASFGAALPGPLVSPHLPSGYKIQQVGGNVAFVLLKIASCGKVEVNGVDVGPSSLEFLTIDVETPTAAPTAPEAQSRFAFEIAASNELLRTWLVARGATVDAASGGRTVSNLSGDYAELEIHWTKAATAKYVGQGLIDTDMLSRQTRERWFFGEDARTQFLDQRWSTMLTGAFPGRMTMSSDTGLSKLAAGAQALEGDVAVQDAVSWMIAGGAASA
jgi:hypothetical protein